MSALDKEASESSAFFDVLRKDVVDVTKIYFIPVLAVVSAIKAGMRVARQSMQADTARHQANASAHAQAAASAAGPDSGAR